MGSQQGTFTAICFSHYVFDQPAHFDLSAALVEGAWRCWQGEALGLICTRPTSWLP
ncbi:hypothetical protein DFAR_2820005 [Desulfarculales bacterium]